MFSAHKIVLKMKKYCKNSIKKAKNAVLKKWSCFKNKSPFSTQISDFLNFLTNFFLR